MDEYHYFKQILKNEADHDTIAFIRCKGNGKVENDKIIHRAPCDYIYSSKSLIKKETEVNFRTTEHGVSLDKNYTTPITKNEFVRGVKFCLKNIAKRYETTLL